MHEKRAHSVPLPDRIPARDIDSRIDGAIQRGGVVDIFLDGQSLRAYEGETVAAALLAGGRCALRRTARWSEPRGVYCGIGTCFDCVMTIDGEPSVRTCQTIVRDGMRIESQQGVWTTEP